MNDFSHFYEKTYSKVGTYLLKSIGEKVPINVVKGMNCYLFFDRYL